MGADHNGKAQLRMRKHRTYVARLAPRAIVVAVVCFFLWLQVLMYSQLSKHQHRSITETKGVVQERPGDEPKEQDTPQEKNDSDAKKQVVNNNKSIFASLFADNHKSVRFDAVSKVLESQRGFRGVVHDLPCIPPSQRVLTAEQARDLEFFNSSRYKTNHMDRPLYVYNPSLLPLYYGPETMDLDGRIRDQIIGRGVYPDEDVDSIQYVGVFRVSDFANCHGYGRGVPSSVHNYLGLALLDNDLTIVPGSDVIIDLYESAFPLQSKYPGLSSMRDCQLLALSKSEKRIRDELGLLCENNYSPITLTRNEPGFVTPNNIDKNFPFVLKNARGNGLTVRLLKKIRPLYTGKNMHIFEGFPLVEEEKSGSSTVASWYLEEYPQGPHVVTLLKYNNNLHRHQARQDVVIKNESFVEPTPSFRGPHTGRNYLVKERDSGSACCIRISPQLWGDKSRNHHVLLGITHTKTTRNSRTLSKGMTYNYMSRVYVFDPHPPFNILARSGLFCLGFAKKEEAGSNVQVGHNEQYRLKFLDDTYDCGFIHFVSGLTEKIGDENRVIVSYGVNDCYPRMIEVDKSHLVELAKGKP